MGYVCAEYHSYDGTRSIPTYESHIFRKDQRREYMRVKLNRKLGDSVRRDLALGVRTPEMCAQMASCCLGKRRRL